MKFLSALCFSLLLASAPLHAGSIKEIYSSAQEAIEFYYQASGEWSVLKISKINFVDTQSAEFTLISARTTIKNLTTREISKEICLVTYVTENHEFYSINCF